MSLDWRGEEWLEAQKARVESNVERAAVKLRDAIKEKISIWGPPPSKPGEPPHRKTGALYDSIEHLTREAGDIIFADIGSDRPYAAELELLMNRPYFLATLVEMWPDLLPLVIEGVAALNAQSV